MTAQVVDLSKYRSAHPPVLRLMTAQARTIYAWQRYNAILAAAWIRMLAGG